MCVCASDSSFVPDPIRSTSPWPYWHILPQTIPILHPKHALFQALHWGCQSKKYPFSVQMIHWMDKIQFHCRIRVETGTSDLRTPSRHDLDPHLAKCIATWFTCVLVHSKTLLSYLLVCWLHFPNLLDLQRPSVKIFSQYNSLSALVLFSNESGRARLKTTERKRDVRCWRVWGQPASWIAKQGNLGSTEKDIFSE